MDADNDDETLRQGYNQRIELMFIPFPGMGHMVSTAEIARLLVNRDDRLSVTILIMKLPFDDKPFTSYTKSLTDSSTASSRIQFIDLPFEEEALNKHAKDIVVNYMETYKPHVREAISRLIESKLRPEEGEEDSARLGGIFVDLFSTAMIDVANEFGAPSYVFFTSSAAFLSVMFHLQALRDVQGVDVAGFKDDLSNELVVPGFVNPVPVRVLPSATLRSGDGAPRFLNFARRYRETKGIMVNTFVELEARAVDVLVNDMGLAVYPVGPVLNLNNGGDVGSSGVHREIMEWLDDQPPSSVLFLCFGSMGSFGEDQVKEIADALEHSGQRFLWSLRQPPPKDTLALPRDYEDFREILPEGFLERTAEIGMVIGWAPQVAILSHRAIGGFISHCGWNSLLESVWFGVPIATWPLGGDQQLNAFEMAIELGLALEMKNLLVYENGILSEGEITVKADDIEKRIKSLMEPESVMRERVKKMSHECKQALANGGSSFSSLGRLIEDLRRNLP